ncbi:MAG: glycosyltransferase [Candidatus Levybacteria bacterium]|nr:glycosyltransferase [Candidatus Levybacteria bacterium]
MKKISVSIGTAAYNEEHNIKNMLLSVIDQKENLVRLKEIIVISDGSTDGTVRMVKSIKDKRIKVINDEKRLGKPARVNMLLKTFNADVLVIIDSDMVMKGKNALENIVKEFINDKTTALVCGDTEPLPARTFLESAINNYRYARKSLEKEFCFGNTAYAAHAFLAFSKKFAQIIEIPKGVLNDDAYSYFMCALKGYTYHFAKNAVVLYRSPSSITDHFNQSTRHLAGGIQLYDYFGEEFVNSGFTVPKKIMIKLLFYQLRKNPLGYIFLKILNLYCDYKSRKASKSLDVRWTAITSSKMSVI